MNSVGHANYKRLVGAQKRALAVAALDEDDDVPTVVESETETETPTAVDRLVIPVRRVGFNDLGEIAPWLFPRLSRIWPGVTDAAWLSKSRAWMQMNDAAFVRTNNAAGLAMAQRDDMNGLMRCYERFVFCRREDDRLEDHRATESEHEMLAIYRHMRDWARSKNAIRLNVLVHSDLFPGRFDQYMSGVVKRTEVFVRLSK